MKVLILSCNTGGGHNSAASAICTYFEKMGCECDIVNALDFLPKARAEFISRGHELAYKYTPKLYGAGYRISEMLPQNRLYEQNAKGADELCKVLFSGSYDVVISVHVFAAMMMTELRVSREINIPSFFVATDYTCSPGVSEIVADKYFIPHEKLREEFGQATFFTATDGNHGRGVAALIDACARYYEATGRRISFEYAMIDGVNDHDWQADLLARHLKGTPGHVNLIPLNEVEETGFSGSSRKRAEEIASQLERAGIPATVRRELGSEIDGACGQLRLKEKTFEKKC